MPKGSWREFDVESLGDNDYRSPSISQKEESKVFVQRTKAGKGGKTVTIIRGLKLDPSKARAWLKRLKAKCGSGGTLKGELFELQGDQVEPVMQSLKEDGYFPKRVGG